MSDKQEMRFTVPDALGDAVLRAMAEPGGVTMENMRATGFRMMEKYIADDGFRAAAPLPDNSQKEIDQAVIQVGTDRLTLVQDLISAGLVYNLTDPLSVTQLEQWAQNKVANARRVMSPETRGENFKPDMLATRLPIYLTISQFELDIRSLRMSQRVGLPLDVSGIQSATRAVNESIEDAAINGATTLDGQDLTVAGYKAPGLVNAPNAETLSLTKASWTGDTPVGATVFAQVQAMVAKLVANKKFGPYRLYVSTGIDAALNSDYDTTSGSRGLSIRERILKIPNLQAIRPADLLPNGTIGGSNVLTGAKAVLVNMTSDVVDVVYGQTPTVIPWTSLTGFTFFNMVMGIIIPRVKQDYNSKTGICVGTTA